MIKFLLPSGTAAYNPERLSELDTEIAQEFEQLYSYGFAEEWGMPTYMRPPVVGERVSLKGHTPIFQVIAVEHVYDEMSYTKVLLK